MDFHIADALTASYAGLTADEQNAEINEEAWGTLTSDTSRPFDKPKNGRIAVKVINHLGDEVS